MGLLDKVKEENALNDIKEDTKKNQTVSIPKQKEEKKEKAIKKEIEKPITIKSNNGNGLVEHLSNQVLVDFKDDILDETRFQEYIYKTISKRFEIISKNSKVPKYKIINSVLAQFLNENEDAVQEEIRKFKKKLNDF
jgi:transcription initiation factor IIE alpha subunit